MDMAEAKPRFKRIGSAFAEAAKAMWTHEVPRDAGAISYFSLFVLFPAILVLFYIVFVILELWRLRPQVVQVIVALFPGSKSYLEANLMDLLDPSPLLFLAAFIVVIWGSAWIFTFLENALNRAWEASRRRTFWESRIRNIVLLVLGGVLLLTSAAVSLVVNTQRNLAYRNVPAFAKDPLIHAMWGWIIYAAGFLIAIVVFMFIYKLMPDCQVTWREAFWGAIVAALLWEVDWKIFALLVPAFDSQKAYGTTGFIIALLTWIYTSSLITLYGANFSARLYRAERLRLSITPAQDSAARQSWDKKIRRFPRPGF
jgi:membrane protein